MPAGEFFVAVLVPTDGRGDHLRRVYARHALRLIDVIFVTVPELLPLLVTFPFAVATCGALAYLVTAQFVHYQAADLAHEWHVSDARRCDWAAFVVGRPPAHRPDLRAVPRATAALAPAVALGWVGVAAWDLPGAVGYRYGLLLLAPAIASQGVMEAVWLVATTYVHEDGSAPATTLVTVEGSSRWRWRL